MQAKKVFEIFRLQELGLQFDTSCFVKTRPLQLLKYDANYFKKILAQAINFENMASDFTLVI